MLTDPPGVLNKEFDQLEARMAATDTALSELLRTPGPDADAFAAACAASRDIQRELRALDARAARLLEVA